MKQREKDRLRRLAQEQADIAASQKNIERTELWKRHNAGKGERPPIHIEVDTFANELITPLLECEDGFARELEYNLIKNFINIKEFDDDWVTPPYYRQGLDCHFNLFGHEIKESIMKNSDGVELGHSFGHLISDLGEDFDKITSPSDYGADKEKTLEKIYAAESIFGDILPVRLVTNSLYAVPTQQVVHMMGMENMLYAMYDYPDEFKEMMDRIANAYTEYFKYLENENLLLQNHSFELLAQGSLCFWNEKEKPGKICTEDLWGYMDSQETVSISPEMFSEFIFPCYKKIAGLFGRLSYGCCEPVSAFWSDIKTLPNLKKVSVSPWCDEEYMAQQLCGTDIIYLRKPSPNYLGVGKELDEEAFRAHIEKTLRVAKGCKLEIAQRDVYTVSRSAAKVRRYVEIIRESIENCCK